MATQIRPGFNPKSSKKNVTAIKVKWISLSSFFTSYINSKRERIISIWNLLILIIYPSYYYTQFFHMKSKCERINSIWNNIMCLSCYWLFQVAIIEIDRVEQQ